MLPISQTCPALLPYYIKTEFKKFRLSLLCWYSNSGIADLNTLGYNLSDQEFFAWDQDSQKISRVEVIFNFNEYSILRINFYCQDEVVCGVGQSAKQAESGGKRKEIFEIAEDERLYGCKLQLNGSGLFRGVTWWKIKVN